MKGFFKYIISTTLLVSILYACKKDNNTTPETVKHSEKIEVSINSLITVSEQTNYTSLFEKNVDYVSKGFDFPVGKPDAKGYYNAQKFQENNHLGDDWNGVGGGNSDLGDVIYSIGNGYISEVKNYEGGWGNVVRVVHHYKNKLYESLYAHCDSVLVSQNTFVKKGEHIATIGNCNGLYYAHLHLEIRDAIGLDIGPGYSEDTTGYLDPTHFIKSNRH